MLICCFEYLFVYVFIFDKDLEKHLDFSLGWEVCSELWLASIVPYQSVPQPG